MLLEIGLILLVKLNGAFYDKHHVLAHLRPAQNGWWNWPQLSISPIFYVQLLRQFPFTKILQFQTVSTWKLHKTFLYKKVTHKMLVKLTRGGRKILSLALKKVNYYWFNVNLAFEMYICLREWLMLSWSREWS